MSPLKCPRNVPRPIRRGFTLLEWLVVMCLMIGISAMGAAIWRQSSNSAKKVVCMGNLRSIGMAMHAHAQENAGVLPLTTHSTTLDQTWIYRLEEHLGNFDETRICPSDPRGKERLEAHGTSYILNSFVFVPAVNAFGRPRGKAMNRLINMVDPARTMLAAACSDEVGIAPGRHGATHSDGMDGGSNHLYADGHVSFIRATELMRQIESGINPAQPPGWSR